MKGSSDYKHVLKSTSIFGGAQFIQAILGLFRSKIIAVIMGPSGLGFYSLLSTTLGVATNIFSLGVNVSAVKSISQFAAEDNLTKVGHTILVLKRISWICGVIGMVFLTLFSSSISSIVFSEKDYGWYISLMSISLLLNLLYLSNLSVLQGLRKINKFVKSNVYGNLVAFLLSIPLYYFFLIKGIVFSIILLSFCIFFTTWFYSRNTYSENINDYKLNFRTESWTLIKMGVIVSFSSLFALAVMYLIRLVINEKGSIEEVGLYDAGYTIINSYVSMIFAAMASDFYPKLVSHIGDKEKLFNILQNQIEIVLLMVSPVIVAFISFRDLILVALYSNEFLSINNLSSLIAIGMLFKTLSWPIAYLFLATGKNKIYFINEITINILYLFISYWGYVLYGMIGVGIAFLLTFFIYSIQMILVSYFSFGYLLSYRIVRLFFIQLIISLLVYFLITVSSSITVKLFIFLLFFLSVVISFMTLNQRINILQLFRKYIN
jgi:O-antigen/teichoic acid export membrane protein